MTTGRLTILILSVAAFIMVGCGTLKESPVSPDAPQPGDPAAKGAIPPDQAFMADLQDAFDTTTWERVEFSEVTRGGTQMARPKSWSVGEFLQVSVNLRDPDLRTVPPVEVYVPATLRATPGRCVLFQFDGLVEGAEYVVQTFLPAWFDGLDLGPYHHVYQHVFDPAEGVYEALWLTRYDTPITPWANPPVTFTLLPMDPEAGEHEKWTVDPLEPGDD
jgi:hypothetical protein